MKTFFCILLITLALSLSGCKSASNSPSGPPFCQGGVNLSLKADSNLNLYQGKPHTLLICAYELKEPNGFNQLLNERDGAARIMECSKFDGSVAFVKSLVVQPGQQKVETLDRAEGARYLALTAGYYLTQKERPYVLLEIPAKSCRKNLLDLNLLLGPQSMKTGGK